MEHQSYDADTNEHWVGPLPQSLWNCQCETVKVIGELCKHVSLRKNYAQASTHLSIYKFLDHLFLQTWVDRFRVWMASEVLKKLLAASDSVHTVITACMSHSMHDYGMHRP